MALTLLDPTAQPEAQTVRLAQRPKSLRGKRLGLIKNGKHNSGELLEEVFAILAAELEPAEIVRRTVPITRPAEEELLDELASECDLVIEAVGD
jgi:hypothetical protein